jgi:CheY-like chemotaxis protein
MSPASVMNKPRRILMSQKRILVVENLDYLRKQYIFALENAGFAVDGADNLQNALNLIDAKTYHVALVDLMLRDPEDNTSMEGLEVLAKLQRLGEGTERIVLSTQKKPQIAVDTIKQYGASYYIDKSKLREGGIQYLVEQVSQVADSVKIKKYGDVENILSVMAYGSEVVAWEDRCLRTLKPRRGHMGLKGFFTGFCEPLVPLMPQQEAFPPLAIHQEKGFVNGKFWSKGGGLPVELLVFHEETATELLVKVKPEWSKSDLVIEPYDKHGLVGYAFHLPDAARSEFVERL